MVYLKLIYKIYLFKIYLYLLNTQPQINYVGLYCFNLYIGVYTVALLKAKHTLQTLMFKLKQYKPT
jgi:hypothetical protein